MIGTQAVTDIRIAFLERHVLRDKVLVHAIRLEKRVKSLQRFPVLGEQMQRF
jgi:hypothetical protein